MRICVTDQSDGNYICFVAKYFLTWIDEIVKGDDECLRVNVLYVNMTKAFATFSESYRCGDAIGIELGYEYFVPIWRAYGQHRYVGRHWRQ